MPEPFQEPFIDDWAEQMAADWPQNDSIVDKEVLNPLEEKSEPPASRVSPWGISHSARDPWFYLGYAVMRPFDAGDGQDQSVVYFSENPPDRVLQLHAALCRSWKNLPLRADRQDQWLPQK